ncbi:MAG: hypothetical protein GWP02_02895 [Desulfobulbaceae bacterium]|nr:hypothetical protein [Desulfobulbaceae bacterium]
MTRKPDIPWTRIFAEGVAVVASILLAFAIDAWWDERQIRVEEQQILQGLEEEFISIREVLTRHLDLHLQDIQSLKKVLMTIEDGPSDDAGSSVEAALLEMTSPATTDLGNGTLDALLSSGRIDILTNRALRFRLAGWERVIGEVWDDQANNAKMVFEIYIPYFISENVAVGVSMSQLYDWPIPATSIADDPDAIQQLLGDKEFRVLAEIRYGFKMHLTGEFKSAIAAAEEILAEIKKSMN